MRIKQYLEIGKITTTHGVMGEMRLFPWCDDAKALCNLKWIYFDSTGKDKMKAQQIRVHKNILIVRLEGVDSIDAARQFRDRTVYAFREDLPLPKGYYFIQDLLGCKVFNADFPERCYGELKEILQTGANDVYRIVDENGVERLLPAISETLENIDVSAGEIYIRPLKGLFEDED